MSDFASAGKAPEVEMAELVSQSHKPTLTGSVSDVVPGTGVSYVTVTIAGRGVKAKLDASRTTWTVTWPRSLSDGVYNVGLLARDNAGNVTTEVVTAGLTVDSVKPTVSITTSQVSPTGVQTLAGTVTDKLRSSGISSVLVMLNGETHTAAVDGNAWSVTVTPSLSTGLYSVITVALDNAGNAGSAVSVLRVSASGASSGVGSGLAGLLSTSARTLARAVDTVLARAPDAAEEVLPRLTTLRCVNDLALSLLGY